MKTAKNPKLNSPLRLFIPAMILPEGMAKKDRDDHLRRLYGVSEECRIFVGQEALDELRLHPPVKATKSKKTRK